MRLVSSDNEANLSTYSEDDLQNLDLLEKRVRWISTWMIHNANNIREKRDGLKVGGHQASCASISTLLAALYFGVLRPQDRVAVKPHASPIFHAIEYLLGKQSLDQLMRFRALGGAQSYPSRTKDKDDVDFSTGSVGLGVAITAFASLVQDYLISHGWLAEEKQGRMITLLGDAELDEGNIYEALIEAYKHNIRNTWWIVDYNRQSLDAITSDRMFRRFDDIFATAGWKVVTLKYGKKQQAAFKHKGGEALRDWIDNCPNDLYAALTYKGGAAWREQLLGDLGKVPGFKALLKSYDDDQLSELMTELGGHCMETILEAFNEVDDDVPHMFIAYTIKGYGLPLAGHKDNHAGLMNTSQVHTLRDQMNIPEGEEWDPFSGLTLDEAGDVETFLKSIPFAQPANRKPEADKIAVPAVGDFPHPSAQKDSTQAAFGKIMNDLARGETDLASRIVTTSPDVTVSTNLGAWVNQRGLYNRNEKIDIFKEEKIESAQKWIMKESGQHLELGIAENNLFLVLAALGMSHHIFGERLLPVGTLYDPFIARGLDALNYGAYQDSRFMLVATPAGITLGPEGGAHQSINTPLIGMAQPGMSYFEPAYIDELSTIMQWGFEHMQADDGGSVYLRLTTRTLDQAERSYAPEDLLKGAYWHIPPAEGAEMAIVYTGAIAPEAIEAHVQLIEDVPGAGLLAVPSADILHRDWMQSTRSSWKEQSKTPSHIENLLAPLSKDAGLVTVIDGAPTTLSWLGAVRGHRVAPLGIETFGQSGDLIDLYDVYGLDTNAILEACASLYVRT